MPRRDDSRGLTASGRMLVLSAETADVCAETLQLRGAHAVDGGERSQIPGPGLCDGAQNAIAEDKEGGLAFFLCDGKPPLLEPFFERGALGRESGRRLLAYLCRLAALRGIPRGALAQRKIERRAFDELLALACERGLAIVHRL